MNQEGSRPAQRVAPMIVPDRWDPPGKPEGALPVIQDAYRQTQFQLGSDLRLLKDGMNLQLAIVRDSYPSRYRTLRLAAMSMYWSRAFLAIGDACHVLTRASYPSCPILVRAACEAIAAELQVGNEDHAQFLDWLSKALQLSDTYRATDIGLGTYAAGAAPAAIAPLAQTYRVAGDLAGQHFGPTLIEVAAESNGQRLAVAFGDQTFHFAWAQLIFGWLLTLCMVQIDLALADHSAFYASEETRGTAQGFKDHLKNTLEASQRCRIEEIDDNGSRRLLLHNFRRQSGDAAKRILL